MGPCFFRADIRKDIRKIKDILVKLCAITDIRTYPRIPVIIRASIDIIIDIHRNHG